jgi:LPS export ABC transporter protein LptC
VKRRLSLPLLLCAALLIYALTTPPPVMVREPAPTNPEARILDSYARTVIVRSFDEAGQLLDRTDALSLRRYKGAAVVELEEPRRWGYNGDSNWVASSQRGLLREERETLALEGAVNLRYSADGVEFATESLLLNLRTQTALSQAPVRAWQEGNEMRAEKLFANLDKKIATLSGNVTSVYVPDN